MSRKVAWRRHANNDLPRRSSVGPLIGLVAMPIVLLALVLGFQAAQANAGAPAPGPIHVTGTQQHALGIPAITPRAGLMASSASSSGPTFTRDDVVHYVAAHPQVLGAVPGTPAPTVTSVQFVTAKQASTLLHGEAIGLPDTASVCYVRVQGTFVFNDAPPAFGSKAVTYSAAVLVFDAHTGNLLVSATA